MRPIAQFDEAMRWIAAGMTHRQVADVMGIPKATIDSWVRYGRGAPKSGPNHAWSTYEEAMRHSAMGMNDCAISRLMDIPRSTIQSWRTQGLKSNWGGGDELCPICGEGELDEPAYAYLLGLYLGDGYLAKTHRERVLKLEVFLDAKYPQIIEECATAIRNVRTNGSEAVGLALRDGCVNVNACWKHWHCLFPQHGPGPKHERDIRLTGWQEEITERYADRLLRGLIHSDGSRFMNRVRVRGKWYAYPRYMFTNNSTDIQSIFCRACDNYGVRWTRASWRNLAVSRRADVAKLDEIVGPKR